MPASFNHFTIPLLDKVLHITTRTTSGSLQLCSEIISAQVQWHDSVHLSLVYTYYSFSAYHTVKGISKLQGYWRLGTTTVKHD